MKKFSDRLKKIESHNADSSSHKIALNKFADIPKSEFNRGHKGYIAPVESDNSENPDESPRVKRAPTKTPRTTTTTTTTTPRPPVIPASFDWRDYGAISSVKDQGFIFRAFQIVF